MAEKREPAEVPVITDDAHPDHPVEPAEGAREPGEGAEDDRPPHPDEPAEGRRQPA